MSATPKRYDIYKKAESGCATKPYVYETADGGFYRVEDVAPIVNAHDALVEACQYAVEHWEPLLADADLNAGSNPAWIAVQKMHAALAKAKEVL